VKESAESNERRLTDHTRRGWELLVAITTPTDWNAAKIERLAINALTPYVYCISDGLVTVLPGHAAFEVRSGPDTTRRSLRREGGFLRPGQMPQGDAGEPFDVREVSQERAMPALWYIEADQRAPYYAPSNDGAESEQRHRERVAVWSRVETGI